MGDSFKPPSIEGASEQLPVVVVESHAGAVVEVDLCHQLRVGEAVADVVADQTTGLSVFSTGHTVA